MLCVRNIYWLRWKSENAFSEYELVVATIVCCSKNISWTKGPEELVAAEN